MTKQEIKNALMNYRRTPKLISDELEIIRNCESEREKFSPKSASISELPRGSSVNDQTYSDAVDGSKYFDKEIKFHRENIIKLQNEQRLLRNAMQTLTPVERTVAEKTFMSADRRKAPCKAVAAEIGYSESQTKYFLASAMKKLENYKAGEADVKQA